MASRVALLAMLCSARGMFVFIEQPSSSVMEYMTAFQTMLRTTTWYKLDDFLGYYGGESTKPVTIYSNFGHVSRLSEGRSQHYLPPSDGTYFRRQREDGTLTTHGGAKLKDSQYYPDDFGRAVARVFCALDLTRGTVAPSDEQPSRLPGNPTDLDKFLLEDVGTWADEHLCGVLASLRELAFCE